MKTMQKISLLTLSVAILGLSGAAVEQALAEAPAPTSEHLITITTDAYPGEIFGIDVTRGSEGEIVSLDYTDSKAQTKTFPLATFTNGNAADLMISDGKKVTTLAAQPGFTAQKGGYVVLRYLESGVSPSGTYKDFRISIDVQQTIVVTSDPDDSDKNTVKNQFSGVFSTLYLEQNYSKLLHRSIGIKSIGQQEGSSS